MNQNETSHAEPNQPRQCCRWLYLLLDGGQAEGDNETKGNADANCEETVVYQALHRMRPLVRAADDDDIDEVGEEGGQGHVENWREPVILLGGQDKCRDAEEYQGKREDDAERSSR